MIDLPISSHVRRLTFLRANTSLGTFSPDVMYEATAGFPKWFTAIAPTAECEQMYVFDYALCLCGERLERSFRIWAVVARGG